jgi:undecaprenyl diphosphate synthase
MNIPTHVAIICDGNRRWAKEHGLEVSLGHKQAAMKVFEPLVDSALQQGISYLTFWVFSTENWKRSKIEVEALLQLLRQQLDAYAGRLHEKEVRIKVIGDVTKFPQDIQEKIANAVEKTKDFDKLTVVFALNYGGRDEILRAVKRLVSDACISALVQENISEETITSYLDTTDIPDPDLIIRTGGEKRISGFLPWQSAYSEYIFTDTYFPELTPEVFENLIEEYSTRSRRFGK